LIVASFAALKNSGALNDPIAITTKCRQVLVGDDPLWNVGTRCRNRDVRTSANATATALAKGVFRDNDGLIRRQDVQIGGWKGWAQV
jgi:hypothetical protein